MSRYPAGCRTRDDAYALDYYQDGLNGKGEETGMITIEISNPEAIVRKHTGWFTGLAGNVAARLGMIDLEEKVQETIAQRLIEELGSENVRIAVHD